MVYCDVPAWPAHLFDKLGIPYKDPAEANAVASFVIIISLLILFLVGRRIYRRTRIKQMLKRGEISEEQARALKGYRAQYKQVMRWENRYAKNGTPTARPYLTSVQTNSFDGAVAQSKAAFKEQRLKEEYDQSIIDTYGAELGEKLINKQTWLGMTKEQLIVSRGKPESIEQSMTADGVREKYFYSGNDHYVLEKDIVVSLKV